MYVIFEKFDRRSLSYRGIILRESGDNISGYIRESPRIPLIQVPTRAQGRSRTDKSSGYVRTHVRRTTLHELYVHVVEADAKENGFIYSCPRSLSIYTPSPFVLRLRFYIICPRTIIIYGARLDR